MSDLAAFVLMFGAAAIVFIWIFVDATIIPEMKDKKLREIAKRKPENQCSFATDKMHRWSEWSDPDQHNHQIRKCIVCNAQERRVV